MTFTNDIKRYFIIIGILFAVACVGYLIAIYFLDIETEVMFGRFVNADALFKGEPMDLEYPPFALAFMVLPRLFTDTPYWYNVGYVAEVFVFMMVGLYLIAKLAERFDHDPKRSMLLYAIMLLVMLEFILDRYDIFPVIITLASFYCFTTKRYAWAFLLLSVGTMTKLYPAILFPIYLIPFLLDRKWMDALKGIIVFVIAALAIVVPVMILEPDMIPHFIEYHADRPLHIESVAASVIYPFSMLGLTDVWIEFGFGSDNLLGTWPNAVSSWLTPLMVLSIAAAYLIYAFILNRAKDTDRDSGWFLTGIAIFIVLMLFMVAGKVFSSQYLLWIVPPLIFLFMVSGNVTFNRNMFAMAILVFIVTQLNFAYNIGYLGGGTNIDDLGMMLILVRNILTVIMLCYSLRYMYGCVKNRTQATPSIHSESG